MWIALDLFLGLVIGPIMGKMSIAARMEFSSRFMPKMLLIMPTLVTMTLASGWQLARLVGNLNPAYAEHGSIIASFIVFGVMAVIAIGISAGQHRRAVRDAQAAAGRRDHRAADEAVHLHGRDHRRDADRHAGHHDEAGVIMRRLPPIAEIAVVAMALIIIGGITLASRLPARRRCVLVTLLAAAAVLVLADVVLLARLQKFAWPVFFQVAKWSLLAYAVMYGILEFTFIYDHVGGSTLVVLTLMLVVIAVDVPLLFGFSVARYAPAPAE